ncbi:tail fiber assembly protein [Halodesulfovibrio sp.]|jgi:hypothetical protein|uniref:tail fiber assembly protein n=1 Tax=Halodesulfovibrio sp. TaxID=1912772 RepID=UPI0025CD1939|nr:tail fiber assembly protein [Halodesulfovibrio sp.]MCT4627937.1 phage tail assembly chaperone [Halodesulfovibrio sp.]
MNFICPVTRTIYNQRNAVFHKGLKPLNENVPVHDEGLTTRHCMGVEFANGEWRRVWEVKVRPEPEYSEEVARRAQNHCAELLLQCDWTVGADSPLTDENKQEWIVYRKHLRDVNKQGGFPHIIDWGEPPAPIKKKEEGECQQ